MECCYSSSGVCAGRDCGGTGLEVCHVFVCCIACFGGRVFRQMLYCSIIGYYLVLSSIHLVRRESAERVGVAVFFLSSARMGKVTAGGMLCLHLAAVATCAVKRDSITGSGYSLLTLLTPTYTVPNVFARISRTALFSFFLVPGQSRRFSSGRVHQVRKA